MNRHYAVGTGAAVIGAPPADDIQADDHWVGLSRAELRADPALAWATRPGCGAVVSFTGAVRDHSSECDRVVAIDYEAFERHVVPRLRQIAGAARNRWPDLGRVALFHRVGHVPVTQAGVLVVVSAAHREEAFSAARFCIDVIKEAVPVWKREYSQDGGGHWVPTGHQIETVGDAARRWDSPRDQGAMAT
ncbi:molybdopterin synthase catalytic subunit [Streptomyces sp. 2A115]|uniref:molybdopterin synthase catalytic subunit n=1 Tax=Streptomyces sp. 2A115 TaxID=3457439 RepID=UPI003FD545B9